MKVGPAARLLPPSQAEPPPKANSDTTVPGRLPFELKKAATPEGRNRVAASQRSGKGK
jgi:hypothetical protein